MKNEREKNSMTQLLYETDGMLIKFDAVVTYSSKEDGKDYVVLDRTAFFPEGGGQYADTGFFETEKTGRIKVTDVRIVDKTVRHYVDAGIPEGTCVKGNVDENIRYPRMQCHGAEHLISGIIHNMFGYDNVGFHTTEEGYVLDINGPLSDEEIRKVEEEANRAVLLNVPVTVSFPSYEEAQNIDYRSKIDIRDNIRLITIEGYDICACCAPHLSSTGQFGVIKVIDSMPHRGGMRLTMIAGMDAYHDYVRVNDENSKIMKMLSASRKKTSDYVDDLMARNASLKEEVTRLKREITEIAVDNALKMICKRDKNDTSPFVIFADELDPAGLRELVNACTKTAPGPVCAFSKNSDMRRYIFAVREEIRDTFDLLRLVRDFNEKCSGKGGGSNIMAQGSCAADRPAIESYFENCG